MDIHIHDDADLMGEMPSSPFLATHKTLDGPLCVVARSSGLVGSFNVLFLEGHGGPAVGDAHCYTDEKEIRKSFIPVRKSVTIRNRWP